MRKTYIFNESWQFTRQDVGVAHSLMGEAVTLPHTWNAEDGQDGGNDYYRGRCWYGKSFPAPELEAGGRAYLEFRGANSTAEVYLNNQLLTRHNGGYSTFRVDITDALRAENQLAVSVDNSPNDRVYPQKADFTFYGGLYRDVYLVTVPQSHFSMDYHGAPGLQVTTEIARDAAKVALKAYVQGGGQVQFNIKGVGSVVVEAENGTAAAQLTIPNVHLWNGVEDPFLYTATAQLLAGGETVDEISSRFGCRWFHFDKDQGFFLNGKSYPLRGVSRHQDWQGVGNALTRAMHEEDIRLIQDIGANTIRLAHYQHDQYFYDLCDETGMVVWAEIPYITQHLPGGNENTVSQLTELIVQNYNHPSIVCWGLSNEITAVGGCSEDILENHRTLNKLAHKLDKTRPTVTANVFMLDIDSPLLDIPDILSYNLYFGWYVGALADNEKWFEDFRRKNPDKVIGLSEYGADASPRLQTRTPERSDYTEQYQAVYHEHMLQLFNKSPYLWATHVWNMFDFGADGRDEGGAHGINQKGLVSFDRKLKKDAYFAYKAAWSKQPFVHLCGRRYVQRAEATTEIKVYSNQSTVSLYVDGDLLSEQQGNRTFAFQVPITGRHTIEAKAGGQRDSMEIEKVAQPNPEYVLAGNSIVNWFEAGALECPEGYYSIKDTLGEIKTSPQGASFIERLMASMRAKRGDVAQGVQHNEMMQRMMDAMTVEQLLKQAGDALTQGQIASINQTLNTIGKPGK